MADVRLSVAGREYIVTCKDGEEARLHALGNLVDSKAREAGGAGGLNESRTLLFAGLLLADQLHDLQPANAPPVADAIPERISDAEADNLAVSVERLAERLELLVQGLEQSR
jgi:cell division protein ZapA